MPSDRPSSDRVSNASTDGGTGTVTMSVIKTAGGAPTERASASPSWTTVLPPARSCSASSRLSQCCSARPWCVRLRRARRAPPVTPPTVLLAHGNARDAGRPSGTGPRRRGAGPLTGRGGALPSRAAEPVPDADQKAYLRDSDRDLDVLHRDRAVPGRNWQQSVHDGHSGSVGASSTRPRDGCPMHGARAEFLPWRVVFTRSHMAIVTTPRRAFPWSSSSARGRRRTAEGETRTHPRADDADAQTCVTDRAGRVTASRVPAPGTAPRGSP